MTRIINLLIASTLAVTLQLPKLRPPYEEVNVEMEAATPDQLSSWKNAEERKEEALSLAGLADREARLIEGIRNLRSSQKLSLQKLRNMS
jgi:hypothetical protein